MKFNFLHIGSFLKTKTSKSVDITQTFLKLHMSLVFKMLTKDKFVWWIF